jgi:hypothetical protein
MASQKFDNSTSPVVTTDGTGGHRPEVIVTSGGGGDATAANQATQISAEQAILAKIIAAPATEAKQDAQVTALGSLTETAPSSDTAASGLNGRLQRIAQNITALIAATITTKEKRSSTGTHSNVAGNASSVTILASNANRLGASIFNDSGAILYLDTTGGTATTSNYTLQIAPNGYYEMPFQYTGLITGIWASATGNARVVEYT